MYKWCPAPGNISIEIDRPKLFFKLFDAQIQPILTYGCEVWARADQG